MYRMSSKLNKHHIDLNTEEHLYQIHPWRKLMGDLIDDITADVFESMRIYTKEYIPKVTWEETDVTGSYRNLSNEDFLLKKRKFFEALEDFHGTRHMPDVMMNICNHLTLHKVSGTSTGPFAVLFSDYKKQLDDFEAQIAERGIRPNEIFVGRETFKLMVEVDLFRQTQSITGVCICGMYGSGKTSLANQICVERYRRTMAAQGHADSYRTIRVDLEGIATISSLLPKLITKFGKTVTEVTQESVLSHLETITTNTILFMDCADALLQIDNSVRSQRNAERDKFINFLKRVTSIPNPKVKLLMTSRHKLIEVEELGDEPISPRTPRLEGSIIEHELGTFTDDETKQLMQQLVPKVNFTKMELRNICTSTGNLPFSIKMRANQYKLAKGDKVPEFDRDHPIKYTFDSLDDHWQEKLISLSVFQSYFDSEAARSMMNLNSHLDTLCDLQFLKSCHLVEVDDLSQFFTEDLKSPISLNRRENVRYSLHTLTKLFLQDTLKYNPKKYGQYRAEAELKYVHHFMDKWRELARVATVDYAKCYMQMERSKLDLERMLHMQCSRVPERDRDYVSRQSELSQMYLSLDMFVNEYERIQYFQRQARVAKEQGQVLTYCNAKLWEAIQHQERADYFRVKSILARVEKKLQSVDKHNNHQALEIQRAFIKFNRAVVKWTADDNGPEALELMQESLEVYKSVLGNDSFTARILNQIGSVFFQLARTEDIPERKASLLEKSITHHEQAYEMLKILSPEGNHFDMPTYIMNVGTVHHVLGNAKMAKADDIVVDSVTGERLKKEGREHLESALKKYNKAIAIDKRLKLYGYQRSAQILKNKATILSDLNEHDSALELALEALDIRRRCLSPLHPDRPRMSYFVGSLYIDLGKIQFRHENEVGARENWKYAETHLLDAAKYVMKSDNFPLHDRIIPKLQKDIEYITNVLDKSSLMEKYEVEFQRYLERRGCAQSRWRRQTEVSDSNSNDSGYLNLKLPDLSALDMDSESDVSTDEEKRRTKGKQNVRTIAKLKRRLKNDGDKTTSANKDPSVKISSQRSSEKRKHSSSEGFDCFHDFVLVLKCLHSQNCYSLFTR